jgi:3-phenylpropionate/cinnamic acid dioxygenase small subunit
MSVQGGAVDADLRGRIEDFLGELALAIDDGEFERWPGFFTADGFYQIIPREGFEAGHPVGIMTCAGQGMMRDRVAALRDANIYEPHTYCHVLSRPALQRDPDGSIAARSNFVLYRTIQGGSSELFAAGCYRDRITLDAGEPRLASRHVVLESRRVDILIVLPI